MNSDNLTERFDSLYEAVNSEDMKIKKYAPEQLEEILWKNYHKN